MWIDANVSSWAYCFARETEQRRDASNAQRRREFHRSQLIRGKRLVNAAGEDRIHVLASVSRRACDVAARSPR
jgi:hypothetical protein